jgi:hypothetical protein
MRNLSPLARAMLAAAREEPDPAVRAWALAIVKGSEADSKQARKRERPASRRRSVK